MYNTFHIKNIIVDIDACNILEIKYGKYFIFVSLIILSTCICTDNPPKEIKNTEINACLYNGILSILKYFNPCVISNIPLIIDL